MQKQGKESPQTTVEEESKGFEQRKSIPIDHLFLDNTFAVPKIDFPDQDEAYKMLLEKIEKYRKYRVYLFIYSLGKEEVLVKLAEHFQQKIVVDADRLKRIKLMNVSPHFFTTDPSEGFIYT